MLFRRIRDAIAHHMGVCLIFAMAAGLMTSAGAAVSNLIIPVFLGIIIFASCAKIERDDIAHISLREVFGFYVFRFLLIPIALFYLSSLVLPDYKYAILILALMPCGSTLPAMTTILGGNPAFGLGALVLTSFSAPFVVPALFGFFSGEVIEVDVMGMCRMLALVVFVPVLSFFTLYKFFPKVKAPIKANASFIAVSLISCVGFVVISSYRDYILGDLIRLIEVAAVGFALYGCFYGVGWVTFWRKNFRERISFTLMSGINNIALGISLAFLYLPESETIRLVTWEIAWLGSLSLLQFIFFKRKT